MPTAVTVRVESDDDYTRIGEIHRLAFGQPDEARLVEELRKDDRFDSALSLVAVRDADLVGHILFSTIHIETNDGDVPAQALAPMAVLPECQNQGIGSDLVRAGLAACRQAKHSIVIVLGHADYYPRFGFTPAGRYGIRYPFPVPDEAFMAIALMPGALESVAGMVRYAAAFDVL